MNKDLLRKEDKMVVIISDGKKENMGKALYEYYKAKNEEVEFVSVSCLDIKPCYACGGCTYKTYGKCIVRDDMDQIVPLLMKGDIIFYTSPIVWGGFSYNIKKVIDKMALTGSRFYKVKNGELVKGTISNIKKLVGIGVSDRVSDKERKTFENLIKEMGIIIDTKYMGKIIDTQFTHKDVERIAKEVYEL